jgi:MFS family permease
LYFIKEKRRKAQDTTLRIGLRNLSSELKLFILISGAFALANFSYMFFILKAQGTFMGKYSIAVPILLYILFNVFYAIFAIPFGFLSDRIGRKRVLVSGYMLFALTSLGFAFFSSPAAFVILFALYGMVYAIIDGNQRAFVSDLCSKDTRATALGSFHTVVGLMALPASLIAGYLWQLDPSLTFLFGFAAGIVPVGLFIVFNDNFKDPAHCV